MKVILAIILSYEDEKIFDLTSFMVKSLKFLNGGDSKINRMIEVWPEFAPPCTMAMLTKILSQIQWLDKYQGLIQKEKAHWLWERCPNQYLANKIATNWWPNIIFKESKQTIHYIYFLFFCSYVHIMLLIWWKTGIAFKACVC